MMQTLGLLFLHILCLYFLWFLWKDKNKAIQHGGMLTKMGYVSKGKSPRLFKFSVWVDFILVFILYLILLAYSIYFWLERI
jgi:hypothetical protein